MAGRERNPERSRERILDAALEEFASHGFAGARVDAISKRSGLNKQLISHYFGGKRGLYEAVMAARRLRGGGETATDTSQVPGALAGFFERARNDPEWVRVLLWEALEEPDERDAAVVVDPTVAEQRRTRYSERVAWVEAEQAAGRLPADLDPALLFVTLLGMAIYPVLLPDVCELITGARPDADDFASRYSDHLARVAAHLAGP